jgi:hypothetical protein
MKLIVFVLSILVTSFLGLEAKASVWSVQGQWSEANEAKYQEWVRKSVAMEIFTNPQSPYYGISTDCADMIYSLRVIFSYENSLPFLVIDSSQTTSIKTIYISQDTSKFDSFPKGLKRIVAFINYISGVNGTHSLAKYDTYPVALKSLRSGDVYIAEWTGQEGNNIYHSYVIREVSPFGYFELFYSSTPSKVRKLIELSGMPAMLFSGEPWGFRRFKWPQHYKTANKPVAFSRDQYAFLKTEGEHFFESLQKLLQIEPEPVDSIFKRRISNICSQLLARVENVENAILFVNNQGGKCLDKKEFNLYSTVLRDRSVSDLTLELTKVWKKYVYVGGYHDSSYSIQLALDYLSGMDNSDEAKSQLTRYCSVDIRGFYENYQQGKISSHPNSSSEARWGLDVPTTCPSF